MWLETSGVFPPFPKMWHMCVIIAFQLPVSKGVKKLIKGRKVQSCVARRKKSSGDLKQEKIWRFWLSKSESLGGACGSSSAFTRSATAAEVQMLHLC
jgi:hypothetical protein